MTDKLFSTPYSLWESIKWPFLHAFPSLKSCGSLTKIPLKSMTPHSGEKTVKLIFFGDLMNMYGDMVPRCDESLQSLFLDADFIIGNLECPITSELKQKKTLLSFIFQSSEQYLLEFCHKFRVDPKKLHLSLANNHMGDHGLHGFTKTLETLKKLSVTPLGIKGTSPSIEHYGLKVGFLAATEWMNYDCFDKKQDVTRIDDMGAGRLTSIKKNRELDTLVLLPHWGREFRHFPSPLQSKMARDWCTAGADLIVGHHSHVPMPGEFFGHSLCMYGLGNFVSIQYTWPTKLCEVLEVELYREGELKGRIASYCIHPFYLWNRREVLPLSKLNAKLKERCQTRVGMLFDTDMNDVI